MQLAFCTKKNFLKAVNFKNLFYITGVRTLYVSTNISHLPMCLKLLMKLLCFRPLSSIFVVRPRPCAQCPMQMVSCPYCVVCSCYVRYNIFFKYYVYFNKRKRIICIINAITRSFPVTYGVLLAAADKLFNFNPKNDDINCGMN
jgi:hypothetical protein